jgi:hypothetical protein
MTPSLAILRLAGPFGRPCPRLAPVSQRRDFDSPSGLSRKERSTPLPLPVAISTPRSLEPIVRPERCAKSLRICATFTSARPIAQGKKNGSANTLSHVGWASQKRNVAYVVHGTTIATIRTKVGRRVKSETFAVTPASKENPIKNPPNSPEKRNITPYPGATTNISAPISLRSELGMIIDTKYKTQPTLGSSGRRRSENEAVVSKMGLTIS